MRPDLVGGRDPGLVEVPCAALTPPASSPTGTATPTATASATFTTTPTPSPSPTATPTHIPPSATPEWYTPAPGALYPVAQPCRLVSRGGNVNLRAAPWGTILQTLPAGEVVDAVAMTWAASDGTLWLRAVRNGQWVYFARWVMAVRVVTVDDVAIRECADPFVLAVTP
ncbi:MAG: hypothetical protein M5R40_06650 [Anaerolineae bacterium]|nr:hypothetical protein [Anaerolineae bacterium]